MTHQGLRQPHVAARRALFLVSTMLAMGVATPALAQGAPSYPNRDENGVDLATGTFHFPLLMGEIGSGPSKLQMIGYRFSGVAQDNWSGDLRKTVSGGVTRITVTFGDLADRFTLTGGVYVADKGNGSTLVENQADMQFTYTASDGTRVVYHSPILMAHPLGGTPGPMQISMPSAYCNTNDAQACGLPVSITRPNGGGFALTWDTPWRCEEAGPGGGIDDGSGPGGPLPCHQYYRLKNITSSDGYAIKIKHKSDVISFSGVPVSNWFVRDTLKFLNLNEVYCPADANHCDTVAGATVSYGTFSGGVETFTDWRGGVWQFTTSGTSTGIRRPGSSADNVAVTRTSGRVTSLIRDGVSYSYAWSSGAGTTIATRTDSGGGTVVTETANASGRPVEVTTPTGDNIVYTYDAQGRLTRETMPEGNYVQYAHDARGNVTEVRRVAKPGSGLADIVATASFAATCANALTCNKPEWTIDERGYRTDYSYDPTHGGVVKVTLPAPSGSVRPEIHYSWSQVTGQIRDANGNLVTGGTSWMVTEVRSCATAASCAGTADETKLTYGYGVGSGVENLQPLTVTRSSGNGALAETATYAYDSAGKVLSVDGPLAGDGDKIHYRYGLGDRLIGTIYPDPDGAGGRPRRAVAYGYDAGGRLDTISVGTVAGVTDSDWAGFVALESAYTDFDANGRKVRERYDAGGVTRAVTQYSYDSVGRVDCVAVRMNAGVFGSLPASACTASTLGADGPDRITKYAYDAAGRVIKITSGYGTTAASDEVTTSYTDNGSVASVIDAEGNKTAYMYDGHDRLWRTFYPSPVKGAGVNSTADYEQLGYDAAGNVTSRRLRDGTSIGYAYDGLGRLVTKDLPGSEPDTTYSWDLLGRMTGASQGGHTLSFAYDALGRNTSQTGPLGAVTYQYDTAGRRTRMTWADGLYIGYDWNAAGELTAIRENGAVSGAGVLATYTYDSLGRRTSITRGNGTTTTYTFDAVSRLSSLMHDMPGTASDVTVTFGYNPAHQITSRTRSNDSYAWTGALNVDRPYTANGLNQLTASGSTALGYDARGNLTSSGTANYTYTAENMLATAPGGATLSYDPLLRLYQTSGASLTRFQYDGLDLIGEYNTSGTILRRYVHGPGTDEPLVWYEGSGTTTRRWLHADERGSVVAVTDAAGGTVAINSYDEYGIPGVGNTGRFQYTGQTWLPEIGMYHYKARIYSPTLGRFLQTDPIGYAAGMNLYNYVNGDPANLTDPLGLNPYPGQDCQQMPDGSCQAYEEVIVRAQRFIPRNDPTNWWPGHRFIETPCQLGRQCQGQTPWPRRSGRKAPPPAKPSPPRYDPNVNYCGGGSGQRFPNQSPGGGNFNEACYKHDICYSSSGTPRETCDVRFAQDIFSMCSSGSADPAKRECFAVTAIYYNFVKTFGVRYYEK